MATERTPSRSPRRTPLIIGVALGLVLTVGGIVLLTRGDAPPRTVPPGAEPPPNDGEVVTPAVPSFRFEASDHLVRTSSVPIGRRRRQASDRAADVARTILTDLYREGFLDPTNREQGRYDDAFRAFTRGARQRAQARPGLLTAGARAGDRYEQIVPKAGRIDTRILLDRAGMPTLVVSVVRFSALATGPETTTLRSSGQFFLERVDGSWRIVSFHVTRRDTPREAA